MVRRCSCDLTWLSRTRFDLRACFEPALAIHNDTVVGRESFRDDCDILIDRPGVDVARLGDVIGLDHPNVKSLRSTLQRDGGIVRAFLLVSTSVRIRTNSPGQSLSSSL